MDKYKILTLIISIWTLRVRCNYDDRPKIWSSNGNLYFETAKGKSIYLRTHGPGSRVILGDNNLINDAKPDNTIVLAINEIDNLAYALNDVIKRLRGLENGNFVSQDNFLRNCSILSRRINRIANTLSHLESQVNSWSGDQCQIHTCQNGGTCLNLAGGFHCLCPSNWEGRNCEIDVDECLIYNGTDLGCQNGADCKNQPGTYECKCNTGWFGTHCTRRKLDCSAGNDEMCGYGTCVSVNSGEGIECICDQGWTKNSSVACTTDVDECDTSLGSRCSTNPKVECINLPGSFRCGQCPSGFHGDGYVCYDIDECAINNGGCSSMVSCHNTVGSRLCGACPPSFIGDGITCTWRGSCNIDHGGCHPSARCVENVGLGGGPQCECPQDMEGNGIGTHGCYVAADNGTRSCEANPCGSNGRCHMVRGGYTCFCLQGFTGAHCDIKTDSCTSNPCKNGGVCKPDHNTGFRCECTSQFIGNVCQERSYCGSILRAEEGNLFYPLTNIASESNSKCAWLIRTDPDKVINVTFSRFHLERSPDCNFNFLEIHDGRNTADPLIGRFCGDDPPNGGNIVSNQHNLYLWFLTNSVDNRNRFALHWNSIAPICGGEVNATIHGSISSPGSPGKYPPNRDCYWHFKTTLNKRIQLHFFQLDIEAHSNCSFDYLAIYDGDSHTGQLIDRYCSTTQPAPLMSSGPELLIHFHSDAHSSGKGFQITYSPVEGVPGCGGFFSGDAGEITSPTYDGSYLNNLMCEYKIRTGIETQIQLDFKQFDIEKSVNCKRDYLKIYDGPTAESPIMGKFCGKLDRKIILKSTSNNFFMVFRTNSNRNKGGFNIQYKVLCNFFVHGDSGVIKSPGYPFTYPDNRICEYIIETSPGKAIQLTFQDFDIAGEINCTTDNVEIKDGLDANSTLLGTYCGNKIPPIQTSSHNIMKVIFHSDMTQSGGGFYANFTTIDIDCGGIYRNSTGTINYPSEGDKYKAKRTCTWMIVAPTGNYINLNWDIFQLEYSKTCNADYMEIYVINEDNKNTSRRYCGHTIPTIITTTTNTVMLKFVSDNSVQDLGFSLTYDFIDNKNKCGGHYVHNHGFIYSPGWPDKYSRNLDCIWVIKVLTGQQIRLNITQFDVEEPGVFNGCHDYLRVRNGPSESSPVIGEYCGKFKWKSVTSMANTIYIHFHSDAWTRGGGFQIEWDSTVTGCGGTFTGSVGFISSPNYPEKYAESSECFYRIATNPGSKIKLKFSVFELEQFCDDYVEIFDGRDPESPGLGRYCKMPPVIITTSNFAFIKFRSDFAMNGKGFLLDYEAICNNNVTGQYGVIESLNYPDSYPGNKNCTWIISVPKGNKINVTFTNFNIASAQPMYGSYYNRFLFNRPYPLEQRSTCEDYLLIGEPNFINAKPRYCGFNIPPQMSTNGNTLQISFNTVNKMRLFKYSGFRLEWLSYGCQNHIKKSFGMFNKTASSSDQIECYWLIETPAGSSVMLQVTKVYVLETTGCNTDAIEIYNGPDEHSPLLTKFCHNTATVQSTSNLLLLKLIKNSSLKDLHFTAHFHSVPLTCGGYMNAPSGIITSKNYPKNYESNLDCVWTITVLRGHRVRLEFMDIDLNYSENDCSDSVRLFDTIHGMLSSNYSNIICNKLSQKVYTSKENMLRVQFITNKGITARGFKATFSTVCGGVITASENGIIKTDNFISQSNYSCIWTILAPRLEQRVSLTLTHLSLPIYNNYRTNQTCPNSYLRVLDGNDENAPLIDEYCGRTVPPTIVSHGNALTVYLGTHDDRISGTFSAYYSSVNSACGGTLTSESGVIASPNYPSSYPVNALCEWTLKTSPGNKVAINIDMLDIDFSDECNEDYLEIREGDGAGKILGLYCGNVLPSNTTSASQLFIQFRSDNKNPGRGFLLHYNFIHGNDITDLDYGEIASPLYPLSYEGTGEYWWRVTTSSGVININVDKLLIHSHSEICENNLSIYDGYDEDAPLLKNLCGALHNSEEIMRTTSNAAYIKLTLNEPHAGAFFHLRWSRGDRDLDQAMAKSNCGRNNTITIGPEFFTEYFSTPNYPDHYDNNLHCEWVFKTAPGRHLQLLFSDFDIEEREPCTLGDYVSIFESNVPAEWKPVKENLCLYKDIKGSFEASTFMKIIFHSDFSHTRKGFLAQVMSTCGANLTDSSGFIENTVFDFKGLPYRCDWRVKVRLGRRIKLEFINFNITNTENNCKTYIVLRNGESLDSPKLSNGKYCGYSHENRSAMITSGNSLLVSFITNERNYNQKFKLHYEEMQSNCGFQSKLDADHTWEIISSPNYPNVPDPYTECNWVFTGPIGEILRVDFIDRFDIRKKEDCDSEFVEIHDGSSAFSPSRGQYCGNKPGTIKSTSNSVFIKYLTELSEPNNGFKANVSIDICGGTIISPQGEITSPGYPNTIHLPPGTVCQWNIIGSKGQSLSITPHYMTLPQTGCSTKVTIEEWDPISNKIEILRTYCSHIITDLSTVQTTVNNATIKLYIGKLNEYSLGGIHSGFRFTFKPSKMSCHEDFTTSDGFITTPRYPKNAPLEYCHWNIKVPDESRRITLTILDSGKIPIIISENFFDQRIAFIDKYDKTKHNTTFKSSSNTMVILIRNLHDDRFIFKARFSSNEEALCGGSLSGITGQLKSPDLDDTYICTWKYHAENSQVENNMYQSISITGTVNSSYSIVSNCLYSNTVLTIEYYKASGYQKQRQSVCNGQFSYIIPNLDIVFKVRKGTGHHFYFDLQWKLQPCGGLINIEETAVNILDNIPQSYNESLDCSWALKTSDAYTSIEIKIDGSFKLNCVDEFIKIGRLSYHNRHYILDYCKDHAQNLPDVVSFSDIFVEYHAKVRNSNNMRIFVKTATPKCGEQLRYPGVFFSPNFPKGYSSNLECEWEIDVQELGFQISLQFIHRFAIEKSPNCTKDAVLVYDWKDGDYNEVARLCGRELPPIINSTHNRMKIVLRTDNDTNLDGFEAKWSMICDGIYNATTTEQYLYSPNFPYYFPSRHCTYRLMAQNKMLQIKFLEFELEGSRECDNDNLTIISKDTSQYYFQIYCGNEIPTINVMFSDVEIVFNSDNSMQNRGFKMAYSLFSCGGNITEPTILSSGSLATYNNNMNCTWFIEAPKNKKIILEIGFFELEQSFECMNDYLAVYEGPNIDFEKRLALICGSVNPSTVIQSKGNTMTVQFKTDPYVQTKGFNIDVIFSYSEVVGCGGDINITSSSYTLTSPHINSQVSYENFLDCHWNILAPVDHVIKVSFSAFHIAPCRNVNQTAVGYSKCDCDFLQIKDGLNPISLVIGTYCGHTLPPVVVSSGNTLAIRLSTDGEITSEGFTANLIIQESICGQTSFNISNKIQRVKSPGYGTGSIPRGIHCVYNFIVAQYQIAHIHFNDFDLQSGTTDNICNRDRILISASTLANNMTLGKDYILGAYGMSSIGALVSFYIPFINFSTPQQYMICGSKKSVDLYVTGSFFMSIFTYSDGIFSRHKGFDVEVTMLGVCGRNFTELYARVMNSYNLNLNNNTQDCYTLISVPENYTISLYMNEPIYPYPHSYLNIYDGNTTESKKVYTSADGDIRSNNPFFSTGQAILLHNHIYNMEYMTKFDFTYIATDKGRGCGGNFYGAEGTVTSPLYPGVYRQTKTCEWKLETPHGTRLALFFEVFDLGRDCDHNYVQLVDRTGRALSSYCSETPANFISMDNYVKIVFVTNKNNGGIGWLVKFMSTL